MASLKEKVKGSELMAITVSVLPKDPVRGPWLLSESQREREPSKEVRQWHEAGGRERP